MIDIAIKSLSNQKVSVTINDIDFEITIKSTGGVVADIMMDNVVVLQGVKCLPNMPIIPYQYFENGNFFFVTENEEYPDYTKFNVSQSLVYLTPDEMVTYRD
jgi:hypothetical protein